MRRANFTLPLREPPTVERKGNSCSAVVIPTQQQTAGGSQQALRAIVSSVRYLCRTGPALQGQTKDDGNPLDLLDERSQDVPALKKWLEQRDKWLNSDIQNELIEIMAHTVQRDIIKDIKCSPFYGIIAGGTTDVTGNEQFIFCVRWVDGITLNHCLDLALQEVARNCGVVGDALNIVKDVSNAILESKNRKTVYSSVVLPPGNDGGEQDCSGPSTLRLPLCPTRWTVRVKSMKRFVENYKMVQATLKELLEVQSSLSGTSKTAMKGYEKVLKKLEPLLGISFSIALFGPCEQLARIFQCPVYCAGGAKEAAEVLCARLAKLRSDASFDVLWQRTNSRARELGLKEPSVPRVSQPPRRLQFTDKTREPAALDTKSSQRKEFFAAIDRIPNEIRRRFEQPGMEQLIGLERIFADAAEGRYFAADDLKDLLGVHAADFDISRLSAQLVLLPTLLCDEGPATSERILQILQGKSADLREMMGQVVRYLQLVFSVPASAASGERSFSALRRVKTFLRNRMTQRRLTHLLLLHVHKKRAAELQLDAVMREFVCRTAERTSTFGRL
ncbi:hypothetical protein HPB48_012978 [Haemaphysalis longicornis]|uniref:HAT C-terminal dimerisation domain-containing protein n=1 Tax=Haemaphysalis longicornis TaxID=44386 RepID=A0A9J6GAH3_HAELO|nr:hypothetical protein HPB48_012978 [Haemaphysalis longicornis]